MFSSVEFDRLRQNRHHENRDHFVWLVGFAPSKRLGPVGYGGKTVRYCEHLVAQWCCEEDGPWIAHV